MDSYLPLRLTDSAAIASYHPVGADTSKRPINAGSSPETTENDLDSHARNGVSRAIRYGKKALMPLFLRKTGWREG
jgi:hypothetical protein